MSELGWWLFARLWLHDHYNRRLRVGRQEPIWGIQLNTADWLEVTRLQLEIAVAKNPGKIKEIR